MRVLQVMVVAAACAGSVAMHGQIGSGDAAPEQAQHAKPWMIRISGAVLQGQLLTKVDPVYPEAARNKGVEGQVVLNVIVGSDGLVKSVTVVSGPDELKEAATNAVSQWTYKPYLLNGGAIDVNSTVIVNFNLHH